ncbi:MAG: Acetoin:2,6-dichlorophenolindophenol oxidoreductase subunit alpha [Chlamydiae bacterium]|nr:Acetoin:2,6-dichlorophenolindophenol oxidoreductase subunit alpha [Chlamydiota bacterium]
MHFRHDLKALFFQSLRIRRIEEAIADEYSNQEMRCPVHLSIGQEAVAVGVCSQLQKNDYIMSTHRAHAHYLAKGGDLKQMIAELYGKRTGCCGGKGGSMHLVDPQANMVGSTPIVGGSFPLAVGVALASQMKNDNKVTVIFFGEAMTEEGVFSEAINFAALKKLPILFLCESNFYSVYSPMEVRQPKERSIPKIAEAHGIISMHGDGNNLEEVASFSQTAIDDVRANKGPRLLEFTTYRYREHCGPNYDVNLGYRSQEEVDSWKLKCPILRLKNLLLSNNQLSEDELAHSELKIQTEIDEAFLFAKESPFPEEQELQSHIYA